MTQFENVTRYMKTDLITFEPDTDIRDAIDVLLKNKISGAPVLDKHKELIGILSEKDCLRLTMDGDYYDRPSGKGKVTDFMSTGVKTIPVEYDVVEAAHEFIHSHYRRFPVVDRGRLVGQVSRSDILRAIRDIQPDIKVRPSSWKHDEPHP